MFLIQLLLLASTSCFSDATNLDFILDFLKLKQAKSVVYFLCDFSEAYNVFRATNEKNISVKFVNIDEYREIFPPDILPAKDYGKTTCVFDYTCKESLSLLQKFSAFQYFNITYSWLFIANNDSLTDASKVLWKLNSVQMNSDITTADTKMINNITTYNLVDVYAKGRHLCKDIYQQKYGRWNGNDQMQLVRGFNRYYVRGNFNGLRLRGTTTIDRDNVTSDDVDRILSVPGSEQGVVMFVKYHYSLLCIIRDYHNFTIKYRLTRGWAGRLKSGYRLGLIGILSRNEADVAATGIFQRINRIAEFDTIHQSWEFESGFVYRITPQLSGASGGGDFFSPFEASVWIASSVSLLIVLIVLKLVVVTVSKALQNEPNTSLVSYSVDLVGSVAQQGIPSQVSPSTPIRIILISFLFLTLVLYNYYTSAVVGGLLSSPGKGPVTIEEITASPLTLSFLDIGYHRILFRESKVPVIRELYQKKVQPSREGKDTIPVYTDVVSAVPYLKKGGYAFHSELTEAFQDIANAFDANEICELRVANALFSDLKLFSFVLPKRSMYTEMFRITMHRAREIGLVKRNLKIHKIGKPICQSSGRVLPVELSGVTMAFVVLGAGIIAATVVLAIERIWTDWNHKRETHIFVH